MTLRSQHCDSGALGLSSASATVSCLPSAVGKAAQHQISTRPQRCSADGRSSRSNSDKLVASQCLKGCCKFCKVDLHRRGGSPGLYGVMHLTLCTPPPCQKPTSTHMDERCGGPEDPSGATCHWDRHRGASRSQAPRFTRSPPI